LAILLFKKIEKELKKRKKLLKNRVMVVPATRKAANSNSSLSWHFTLAFSGRSIKL